MFTNATLLNLLSAMACFTYSVFEIFVLLVCLVIVNAKRPISVIPLNEDTWRNILTGEWMVEFYAPWCPACKGLAPVWKDFADWSEDLGINIAHIDVTENPGLSGRFLVTALPTIFHVSQGTFRQYRGSRTKEDLIRFIEDSKWKQVEELQSWKHPDSFQMSCVSYLFRLSMILRNVHNSFIEDYGIPYWGSYLIFGAATIVTGAVLGLLLVCAIDVLSTVKIVPSICTIRSGSDDDMIDDRVSISSAKKTSSPSVGDGAEPTNDEDDREEPNEHDDSFEELEPEEQAEPNAVRKRKAGAGDTSGSTKN